MTILSQAKKDGIIQPWANEKIGFSNNLIHAKGDQITILAEILALTPIEINEKLKESHSFIDDQIMWDKLFLAFPEWSAQVTEPYSNDLVLQALQAGRSVIVLTEKQAIRYMGGGVCHDPKTGTERPTRDFPEVKSFIVLTHLSKEEPMTKEEPKKNPKGEIHLSSDDAFNLMEKMITPIPLTQKQKNAVKKYLKQMHVANLAIKRLLDL